MQKSADLETRGARCMPQLLGGHCAIRGHLRGEESSPHLCSGQGKEGHVAGHWLPRSRLQLQLAQLAVSCPGKGGLRTGAIRNPGTHTSRMLQL